MSRDMMRRMAEKRRRWERNRRRGIALARRASATLKRAGFTKAGPYRTFGGHYPDGYGAGEAGNGTSGVRAVVWFSRSGRSEWAANEEAERAFAVLREAGFNVDWGTTYKTPTSFDVTLPEEEF